MKKVLPQYTGPMEYPRNLSAGFDTSGAVYSETIVEGFGIPQWSSISTVFDDIQVITIRFPSGITKLGDGDISCAGGGGWNRTSAGLVRTFPVVLSKPYPSNSNALIAARVESVVPVPLQVPDLLIDPSAQR